MIPRIMSFRKIYGADEAFAGWRAAFEEFLEMAEVLAFHFSNAPRHAGCWREAVITQDALPKAGMSAMRL